MPRRSAAEPGGVSTRERILHIAEELISRHGMEGLRLKDVAEHVGIQPPSIFAHFEGREAIGDAVAHRVLDQIAELVEAATKGGEDPAQVLRAGVRAFAGHLVDHPGHARLLMRDLTRTRGGREIEMSSPAVGVIEKRIDEVLAWGERTGAFRPITGRAFISLIQGAILASVGWAGFHDDGRPATSLSREEIQHQAEDLALAYVRRV